MFILIEGADGTGKSTLAEAVLAEMRAAEPEKEARLEHYGVPKYDSESRLTIGQQAMNQLLERFQDFDVLNHNVVVDRFHWGEPVYAPVFRPHLCVSSDFGTLTPGEFYHVEHWLQSIGAVNVWADNEDDVILRRVLDERVDVEDLIADDPDSVQRVKDVRKRYHDLVNLITRPSGRRPVLIQKVELLQLQDTELAAHLAVDFAQIRAREALDRAARWTTGDNAIVAQMRPRLFKPQRRGW